MTKYERISMLVKDLAKQIHLSEDELINWLKNNGYEIKQGSGRWSAPTIDDGLISKINEEIASYGSIGSFAEQVAKERAEVARILITSGFSFDGFHVVKYSGYISGDAVFQIPRGTDFFLGGTAQIEESLSKALVSIRRKALTELKEAAYNLGCNAVIGVDFDYLTLEPETANIVGGTTYLPYVICVTANGNAVIIEKDNN